MSRRSCTVAAPLLASAALTLLAGCHDGPEMQRCVDNNNRVVDPKFCQNLPGAQPAANGYYGTPGGGGFHYYYGGRGSYAVGSLAEDGSTTPATGHSYSTTTGTERGGFGSSFGEGGSHGGGGEGGGE